MKLRMMMIAGILAVSQFCNAGDDALDALGAKFEQRCQEFKQEEARLQQIAQSPTASQEKKDRAAKDAAQLHQVVKEAETMLKDPALKSSPEKREAVYARVQSTIVYGNAVVLSSHSPFAGGAPSSAIEQAVRSNIDDYTMKVSRGFDGSKTNTNDVSVQNRGTGTRFFSLGGSGSASAVNATYKPTTPAYANEQVKFNGSIGGGILLEESAQGVGRVSAVKYDGRYNALVMDNHLVYFLKVPSWEAAALCRDIARDVKMRVGVSMGTKTNVIYGARVTYENTAVGRNLLLTDHFLGDFVFGWRKWSKGYNLPDGYEPKTAEVTADMLVQFVFRGFQFATKNNELQLTNLAIDVRFMPVSKQAAGDGGMLPDMDALERGYTPPPEFLANAQYFTSHFEFFRRERIVDTTIAYGELAALLRSYKQAGINLEALASELERG